MIQEDENTSEDDSSDDDDCSSAVENMYLLTHNSTESQGYFQNLKSYLICVDFYLFDYMITFVNSQHKNTNSALKK